MIIVDIHSRIPIYEQIKEQVMLLVREGVYKPHDQLPSTRTLAAQLKLNVNTVKRAFQELEAAGVTYSLPGRGIFVSENSFGNAKIRETALSDIEAVLNSARAKGVIREDVERLLEKVFERKGKTDD